MNKYKIMVMACAMLVTVQVTLAQPVAQNFNLSQSMRFEENKGQVANTEGEVQRDILFTLKDKGMNVYFRRDGISYQWHYTEELMEGPYKISEATGLPMNENEEENLPEKFKEPKPTRLHTYRVDMKWQGSNENVQVVSEQPFDDYNNYYLTHCPDGITHVNGYSKLTYKDLYPGIDVQYYFKDGHLKYDVLVAAGADLSPLQFIYTGATPQLQNGKVKLSTPLGWLEEQQPVAWDERGEVVDINYNLKNNRIGFGKQTLAEAFTIDPGVIWATYYGGTGNDWIEEIRLGLNDDVFVSGTTASSSNIESGGHQSAMDVSTDAFLVKLNANGQRQWATYYGGNNEERGYSVAIDNTNSPILAGYTRSTTAIPYLGHQLTYGGNTDAFLVKFDAQGVRLWASYYGGASGDYAYSIVCDPQNNIYMTGYASSASGIASGGHQNTVGGSGDAFLVKFNSSGVRQWGSYFGGGGSDNARSIALDASNNIFITGETQSTSAIATSGAHQVTYAGGSGNDAFLAKFTTAGVLSWATYMGGTLTDNGQAVSVDSNGNAYIAGLTYSNSGIAFNGFQSGITGQSESFLVKFNGTGVRLWGTYYGGTENDQADAIAVDDLDNVYLVGDTRSTTGVASGGYQNTIGSTTNGDAFLVKFKSSGERIWGSYFGGTAFEGSGLGNERTSVCLDSDNNIYVAGLTTSSNGIAFLGHQNTLGGGYDGYIAKFQYLVDEPIAQPTNVTFSNIQSTTFTVSFSAAAGSPTGYIAVRKTGSFSTTDPVEFSSYSVGETLGDGIVVHVGSATSFNQTALSPSTNYFYKIYAFNSQSTSINYRQSSPLSGSQATQANPPTVTSFSPLMAVSGTPIIITGTNFNTTLANNIVIFGATRATVTAATSTQLTVTVPIGATYAPITVLNTTTSLLAYSSSNFTPTFTPNNGNITTADFSPKVDFTTGTDPTEVAIGDLDGDGKADLAVLNSVSNTVSVFRNTGSSGTISYASKWDYSTGTGAGQLSVSMGDLNGDGKTDLVASNPGGFTVFRNTGSSGTIDFAPKVDFAVGNLYSTTIGDLDGDGKADLAVTTNGGSGLGLAVFRNSSGSSSISFDPRVDYATGDNSTDVAVGDLDGDGKTDLAVVNYNNKTVSVYRNTGSPGTISFATNVDFTTGSGPTSVSIGDLDGDGRADLAVANYLGHTISVLRNTGSTGTINYATKVDYTTGTFPRQVAIGDLDGDNKVDLAVANFSTSNVSVFRNTSSSGIISYSTKVDLTTGTNPWSVAIGDLDGDGKSDLALAARGINKVDVIRNNPLAIEPSAQPTNLLFSNVTSSSMTLSYTAAVGSPAGYIVVRKSGSEPTTDPVDGTAYTVGGTLGDGTIGYVGNAITFSQTGLVANTTYHYKIYSYNGSGATINYKQQPSPLVGSQTTLAAEPTAQPTSILFSSVTSTSMTVSYTAATGTPAGYIAVRRTGAGPTTDPVDGTAYTVGGTVGDGTIAFVGSTLTFNEISLTASTAYHYKIYSYNGSGATINYRQTTPLTGSQTTFAALASEPTAQPTSILFSSLTSTSMTVSYTTATGTPSGYIAVRRTGAAPTTDPVDGTAYTVGGTLGDGTIAFVGSAVTFNETGLTASTAYHYKIYSYNGSGGTINYRQTIPLAGSQTTSAALASEPTAQPTSILFSSVTSTSMTVSYTAATGAPAGYIAVRRTGAAPTTDPVDGTAYTVGGTLGDGTIAFVGSAVTFNETGLTASTAYHYKIYTYNGSGGTINYRQTTPLAGSQTTSAALATEPTAQPTSILFSSITSTSMTVSYTAATGTPAGYIAVRRTGAAPTSDPVDGTSYTVGGTLGDGTIAFVGSALTFNETSLTASTAYHYKIYSYNGSGAAINYRQTTPLTGSQTTFAALASEPTAQPTSILFSSVTSTSMTVSYTTATGTPSGYIAVRRTGAAPTTDPVDGTAYTVGGTLGDGTIAFVGSAVTFNETGLTASTAYHYKIYTYNGSGGTINYRQTTPLAGSQTTSTALATEPTAQPTSILFSSITSTSMTVSYTAATGTPAGYIAVRRTGAAPTTDPVDGTDYSVGGTLGDGTIAYVGSAVTFNETGLTASTVYHYKLYSFNGSGVAINYLQTSPLSGSQTTSTPGADTTPPQPGSNTTPDKVTAGSVVNVAIAISDTESGVTDARISYGPATSGTFLVTDQSMTNTGGTWSFTIPASAQSELGVRYRVVATNGATLTTTIGPITVGIDLPTGVTIPYTAFGSAISNYRIIALPINLTTKSVNSVLGDNLGNYGDQSKWRMFRYSSGQTQELNGSSSLEQGMGYWLIATDNNTLDSGPGVTNGGFDNPVTLPVTQGWNQIGNPYGFNLAWSDITTANSALGLGNLRVYRTGSGFADATTLNTSEGGFVFANNAGTLTFSALKNASVNGRQAERQAPLRLNSLDGEDWEVRFTLESGTIINELSGVGMHPNAQTGFDAFDDFTLPRFGSYLELNHTKELHGSAYSRDIVSPAYAFSWQFEVDVAEPGPVTLHWSNLHLQGSTKKLVLWDMDARLPVNMERITEYKFNAPRKFALHYGDKDYLQNKLGELQLALYEPYPNPASGNVELQVWIPYAGTYALEVVDPLGRMVQSLFNEKVEAGYHRILWQRTGSTVPGLYMVKLWDSKHSVYQKLVIH